MTNTTPIDTTDAKTEKLPKVKADQAPKSESKVQVDSGGWIAPGELSAAVQKRRDDELKLDETPVATEPAPRRREILDDADEKILGGRDREYGDPHESFSRIADLWTARSVYIDGAVYTPADVAQMMALVKIARLAYQPDHADSWVDLAGYAAIGGEVSAA